MHQRTPSHSYRIPVTSAASGPSPPSLHHHAPPVVVPTVAGTIPLVPRPRKRHQSDDDGSYEPLLASAAAHEGGSGAAAGWIPTRLGGRQALRKWMLVVLGLGATYVVVSTASSPPSPTGSATTSRGGGAAASWNPVSWWASSATTTSDEPDDWMQPPRVDRTALEKLRLLEIHYGADEGDDDRPPSPGEQGDRAGDPAAHAGELPKARIPPGGGGQQLAAATITPNDDTPPVVAEIPEFVKPNPLAPPAPEKLPTEVLDRRVCGAVNGAPCRFLVPAWLGEQETKAQQHLYQLGLLALALNRTLVLPNVSKSRLGTCYKNPFSFYYSPSSLTDLGIPTISQEDFIDWTLRRETAPTAQVVTMSNAKADYSLGAVEIDSAADPTLVPSKQTRNLCLKAPRTRLDFAPHSPLSIYPPEGYHRSEAGRLGFGESVITTLRSRKVVSKSSRLSSSSRAPTPAPPDVLAFNYELRFPILSSTVAAAFAHPSIPEALPFAHFPYADIWNSLGSKLVERLSPFVAIHWRTETLTPANLAPCGKSLLDKLLELKKEYPSLRNVYLATDYPIESLDPSLGPASRLEGAGAAAAAEEVAHSGTFAKVVTPQHHAAMKKFLKDFAKRAKGQLRLTTFAKEQGELANEAEAALSPELVRELVDLTTPLLWPPPRIGTAVVTEAADTVPEPVTASEAILSLGRLDSGLYGILDKLVAMRAELFVTGTPGVGSSTVGACAKLSSFTNQLVAAREEQRLVDDGLWNTVEHFELAGR